MSTQPAETDYHLSLIESKDPVLFSTNGELTGEGSHNQNQLLTELTDVTPMNFDRIFETSKMESSLFEQMQQQQLPVLVHDEASLQPPQQPQQQPQQQQQQQQQLSLKQRMLGGRFASFQQRVDMFRYNDLRLVSSNNSNSISNTTSSSNLGRNSLGNATMVNTPTPPDDLYTQDNFLNEFDWEYDNNSFAHADSTTLASEGRASYDFAAEDGNFRPSTEYIDSIRPHDTSLPVKSSITSTISNSLSNMFKMSSNSNNSNNNTTTTATTNNNNTNNSTTGYSSMGRFTLRSMNPLSHKEDNAVPQLENLAEDMEMSYSETQEVGLSKKKSDKNISNNPAKKKRTTLTSALANARLPFSSSKRGDIPTDVVEQSVVNFEFDEELTRVISMASLNSSSYNFNANQSSRASTDGMGLTIEQLNSQLDLHSLQPSLKQEVEVDDAFANISLGQGDIENVLNGVVDQKMYLGGDDEYAGEDGVEGEQEGEQVENHSPDYAALFSNVKTKKKSKTLASFRKKSSSTTANNNNNNNNLPSQQLPVIKVESSESSTTETILPPIPEGTSLPIVPPADEPPRRGRKPTLEYDASKQFVCSYCLRRFRRQEHLKRHFRSLHTNEKPFDCTLCGKKFSRNDNLAQHIKTHSEEGGDIDEDLE